MSSGVCPRELEDNKRLVRKKKRTATGKHRAKKHGRVKMNVWGWFGFVFTVCSRYIISFRILFYNRMKERHLE